MAIKNRLAWQRQYCATTWKCSEINFTVAAILAHHLSQAHHGRLHSEMSYVSIPLTLAPTG